MRITFNHDVNRVLDFARICQKFDEDIDVYGGRYIIDAKSHIGLLSICSRPVLDARIITDDGAKWFEFRKAIKDYLVNGDEDER